MNDTFLISIVTFTYFSAAFVFLISIVFNKKSVDKWALIITVAGLILQTSAIIMRWIHSYQLGIGHAPLSNFYESLVFFSWSIIFVYLIMRKRYQNNLFGLLSAFFAFFNISVSLLVRQCKLRDPTPYPRPSKQLADKSCY